MDEYKFVELKQRHVEALEEALPEIREKKPIASNGLMVRTAFRSGWFEQQLTDEEVSDLPPGVVLKLANRISKEFARVLEIPKN